MVGFIFYPHHVQAKYNKEKRSLQWIKKKVDHQIVFSVRFFRAVHYRMLTVVEWITFIGLMPYWDFAVHTIIESTIVYIDFAVVDWGRWIFDNKKRKTNISKMNLKMLNNMHYSIRYIAYIVPWLRGRNPIFPIWICSNLGFRDSLISTSKGILWPNRRNAEATDTLCTKVIFYFNISYFRMVQTLIETKNF